MKKSIKSFKVRNAGFFLGMCLLVGCSNNEQTITPIIPTKTSVIESEDETSIDRLAADLKKDVVIPISAEDVWDHIILYERDVRYYTDGSIGYSEWNLLGEYYVRNADLLENELEYKVERLGTIDLNEVVSEITDLTSPQLCYVGDSKLKVDNLKMFTVNYRNFIDGEYTEYNNDGTVYLTDDELEENDLVNFDFLQNTKENYNSKNSVNKIYMYK